MLEGERDSSLEAALSSLEQLHVEQLRCHRIDADLRRVIAIPRGELANFSADNSEELWIDIQVSHPRDIRTFLETLKLHPLIMEDCLDANRSSRFSSYSTSLHFEAPALAGTAADSYLSVLCVPRILITIRNSQILEVDGVLQDMEQRVQLNEGTKSALLYAILDALTARNVEAASRVRDEIRQMSQLMDAEPGAVKIGEIIAVKRRVQDIATVAEDQMYCVSSLIPVDSEAFPISQQRDYFRDSARNYESALRVLNRYESRAAELQQQYVSSLQARTESRIRTLTILSAICMPLTLMAGIYGMNFAQMPELQISWGYPATLIVMFLIAVAQLWYFYRRGWFR